MRLYPSAAMRCSFVWIVFLMIGGSNLLPAQDVTVGEPTAYSSGPVGKRFLLKRPIVLRYPSELIKMPEPGYVIVDVVQISEGVEGTGVTGTHEPFRREVYNAWIKGNVRPADGKATRIETDIYVPVIFNPLNASATLPNATPRLLMAKPLLINPPMTTDPDHAVRIPVRMQIDATGKVTDVKPRTFENSLLAGELLQGLQEWRFAPARQNDLPVAGELNLTVICHVRMVGLSGNISAPKLISGPELKISEALRRYGMTGSISYEYTVAVDGTVKDVVILKSNNPAFEEAVIEQLLQSRFEPVVVDGVKVERRTSGSTEVQRSTGKPDPFAMGVMIDQSKLPPELRFDTPAKVTSVRMPVYPYVQRRDKVRGKAAVRMLIGVDGHVTATKVTLADHPEFGLALVAALERFTFDPAYKDGVPVRHVRDIEQIFSAKELPDDAGDFLIGQEKTHPEKIFDVQALDVPVTPVSREPAPFPTGLAENIVEGEAEVEFLIDENGHARLPRIVSASEPAFGYAAVQAASAWWYKPPLKAGKPVVTRIQVQQHFKRPQVNR